MQKNIQKLLTKLPRLCIMALPLRKEGFFPYAHGFFDFRRGRFTEGGYINMEVPKK